MEMEMYTMLNEEIDTRDELHRILRGLRDIKSHTDLIHGEAARVDVGAAAAAQVPPPKYKP